MDVRTNRFLADFSPAGQELLAAHAKVQDFPDDTNLFHEGDPSDGIYLVLEGEVEILRTAGNHREILGLFNEGDFLGEVAVLDGYGRSTTARSRGPVKIAKIPREPLMMVLESEPVALTIRLFQNVLSHLRKANDLIVTEVVHKEKMGLVGEMAGSLMHDLRNPVAGIRLAADLITMNHQDEETAHCCNGIRMQCDRLVIMATELLEFSRGESKLIPSPTTTTAFLKQFRELNPSFFENPGVAVTIEAEDAPIHIDSLRLVRVVQNLVSNAVEAVGPNGGGIVKVRAWVEGDEFFFDVRDNGPGIPETIQDRIYEPFVTHGKTNGTGLGMAIVRNIVTAHGGTIVFETGPDIGTTFLVRLPRGN